MVLKEKRVSIASMYNETVKYNESVTILIVTTSPIGNLVTLLGRRNCSCRHQTLHLKEKGIHSDTLTENLAKLFGKTAGANYRCCNTVVNVVEAVFLGILILANSANRVATRISDKL